MISPTDRATTRLIVVLHDKRRPSFDQIGRRLWHDFGIRISYASLTQRYRRARKDPQ